MCALVSRLGERSVRGLTRRQLTRGKIGSLLKRRGFGAPYLLLKCLLCRLPSRLRLAHCRLTRGGQRPPPLPTVVAGRSRDEASFPDESQRSRRGRLVDADCIREFRRRQIRNRLQYLQRRELRGVEITISERCLIQRRRRSRRLTQRRAVARKRLQFHGGNLKINNKCICMRCQVPDRRGQRIGGPRYH